jgi:hypothetical protein
MKTSIFKSLLILATLVIPIQGKLLAGNKHVDPTVTISAGQIVEADDTNVMLEFTISLSSKPTRAVVVRYDTTSITAIEGIDFLKTSGQEVFKPSKKDTTSRTIQIPVIGDYEPEGDENFDIVTTRIINGVEDTPNFFKALIVDNDKTELPKSDQIKNLRQIVYTESLERGLILQYSQPTRITGLDLENDGDQDIVVIYAKPYDNNVGEVVVYRNDNSTDSGWVIEPTGIFTNAGNDTILIDDFNGDGTEDLFVVNPYGDNVLLAQVDGSLVETGSIVQENIRNTYSKGYQKQMTTHASGDLDNDGDVDVFVVAQNDPYGFRKLSHIWYINDGKGNFTAEYRTNWRFRNLNYSYALSAGIGDFNNDGINEVFLGTNNSQYKETSAGRWTGQKFDNNNMLMSAEGDILRAVSRVTNDISEGATNMATNIDVEIADVNGDGWMDVITQTYDQTRAAWSPKNHRIDVYFGNGDGTFDLSQSLNEGELSDANVVLEDVNGDGFLDLVGLPQTQFPTYYTFLAPWVEAYRTESVVYINDGSGFFTEDNSVVIEDLSILSAMFFKTSNNEFNPVEMQQ